LDQLRPLRVDMPVAVKDAIKADSAALGIPAYTLYRKILEDFVSKPARDRKKVYLKRRSSAVVHASSVREENGAGEP